MGKPLSTIFNLGSSHVSASKFSLQEDGLSLDRFKLLDLPPNSGNEQEWLSAIEIAVSELSSQWGFKGEASFILPSSIVLSKTLRVPKVETEKQRKVVEFELSQKMPRVRDTVIELFNAKRADDLSTPRGRNYLKEEIRNAINGFMVSGKVKGVFFTNFALSS